VPDEINTFFPAADCGAARADFAFEMDTKMESQWEKVRREGGGQLGRSGADQSDSYSKERSLIGMLNKLRSTRSTQPISSSVQPRNESKSLIELFHFQLQMFRNFDLLSTKLFKYFKVIMDLRTCSSMIIIGFL